MIGPPTDMLAWIILDGPWRMVMLLPLALSIAIVYKTTRCPNVQDIPKATAALWITIVLGMYGVGFACWLLFMIFVEWTA